MNTIFNRIVLPVMTVSLVLAQPTMADDDTPLAKTMEQMSDALKSLRKMDKSDWAGAAKAARTAADGCRKGMAFIPILVEEMKDGKEKTQAIADYRRMMGLSYAALCELELAYLDEDQAKVDAAMKKVKAGKKEGHKKYEDD
ncbi:MAG: hypothetical protein KJO21_04870 [Verrucomicrobiae bacterium]|nr:hypothetical protein [Verrucomicrobiae bacterium]NNJ43055.1 hypothetical protein [Akkermansiaceae bacterium]